jgi:hypothetical protein
MIDYHVSPENRKYLYKILEKLLLISSIEEMNKSYRTISFRLYFHAGKLLKHKIDIEYGVSENYRGNLVKGGDDE